MKGRPPTPNRVRFLAKVPHRPKYPKSACWVWTGSCARGYGQFRVRLGFNKYRMMKAHRVAWLLTGKKIPAGYDICHSCDNPPCVRPSHLFPGTNTDNMQDMIRKGRGHDFRGSKNPMYGKLVSEATRLKQSASQRGRKHSSETLKKMAEKQLQRFAKEREGKYGKYAIHQKAEHGLNQRS